MRTRMRTRTRTRGRGQACDSAADLRSHAEYQQVSHPSIQPTGL
jgi:hypothetical protein